MKKIFILIIIFYNSFAHAGLEGSGDIKLSPYAIEQFIKYLGSKDHNIKQGSQRHGRGLVFSISQDGISTGYMYCFQGQTCSIEERKSKNHCQRKAKKAGRENVKCNTFAKGRKIVWNNINRVVPRGATDESIRELLSELKMVNTGKPPKDYGSEQKRQLKFLLDTGAINKNEYNELIKKLK